MDRKHMALGSLPKIYILVPTCMAPREQQPLQVLYKYMSR
jgi:hypothetical protein